MSKPEYRYFYGSCIGVWLFIMVFTFNYIGIYYMSKIIFGLIIILASTWIVKVLADILMDLIDIRVRKSPKNWKIFTQIMLSYLLFMIYFSIGYIFAHLPIFFHEIGHLLTAISFKADITGVFLSPLEGKTFIGGENLTEIQYTIVAATGGLGVILFGIVLLVLLHRNKDIAFIFYFPLSLIILVAVGSDLWYFCFGAITSSNDMGQIIQINPDLNAMAISYFCLLGMVMVIIFWIWSINKKARHMIDKLKD